MIKHTLNCLLKEDKKGSFKVARVSSNPSIEKLRDIYFSNVESFKYIVDFCKKNNIKSLRVISGLFPLATHFNYSDKVLNLLDEVGEEYKKIDYSGIELSSHPDQFILLSSLNENTNNNSRIELELYAYMRKYIPWNLINIHVGSAAQGNEHHKKLFKAEFNKLSKETKSILSIENDEKSYGFSETLNLALESGCMMVPDFHHERCYVKRIKNNGLGLSLEEHLNWNKEIDNTIYEKIKDVVSCYKNTSSTPTFHISSPIEGWNGNFKKHCIHAEYIELTDYPIELRNISENLGLDFRLDVEAKAKEKAIFKLEESLNRLENK